MLNVNEFIVGTNQWLSDTKSCLATTVGDEHNDDELCQIETQTEQSQTVQSAKEFGPTETHMVVDNT